MLELRVPPRRRPEREWVAQVLFDRWLGLPVRLVEETREDVELRLPGGAVVSWADDFFARHDARWLAEGGVPAGAPASFALPDPALAARIGESALPRWFGDGRFERGEGRLRLPIDVTGSAFFMLSRYEEAAAGAARDRHGRPPGHASVAHRAGLALRPLVDEWVELLWWAMAQLAPALQRQPRPPATWISCDVDAPYSPGLKGARAWLRQAAVHLVAERRPRRAAATLANAALARFGVTRFDPFDTFDWMLEENERAGHRVTFFFLAVKHPVRIDGYHAIDEPRIGALMKRIVERGHEVGLHGSYRSVEDPALLPRELADLRAAIERAGGDATRVGARQHYLRWRPDDTARRLAALGFAYDSTLAFPDVAGFRCGTSHAYPLFDLAVRAPLALEERPLVLMETTVVDRGYLGLGCGDEAAALMHRLREKCHRFGGTFSLLWHNSNFFDGRARALYRSLLQRP